MKLEEVVDKIFICAGVALLVYLADAAAWRFIVALIASYGALQLYDHAKDK